MARQPDKAAVVAAVRARDGHRCAQCGMTGKEHLALYGTALEVHRRTPGSLYSLDGCVTLCRRCHGPQPRRRRGHAAHDCLNLSPQVEARLCAAAEANGLSPLDLARMIVHLHLHEYERRR